LNEGTLQATKKTLGPGSLTVRADVSNLADLDAMFATIKREFGHLDGVFVNAGYSEFLPFEEVTEQSFDKVIAVNFKGAYFTIQKALPLLRPGSSVVINASLARARGGRQPRPSRPARPRRASRSNPQRRTRGPRIRVNTLAGPTDTAMFGRFPGEEQGEALSTSSEPTIQASGWPIRWKSRSWQFTSHRTIRVRRRADFLIDGGSRHFAVAPEQLLTSTAGK